MKVFSRTKSLKTIEIASMDFPPSPPRNKPRKTLASQEIKTLQDSEMNGGDHSPTGKKSSSGAFGGLKFHRNLSISSSMQMSAVKRAFSMRRSSSISERYCRIHDQRVALAFASDDDEPMGAPSPRLESLIRGKKSDNGRKTIVKSCKRVLGL